MAKNSKIESFRRNLNLVFDANFLEIAKAIADVFNESFEPGVHKELPPEMVTRPKGRYFGMGDYVG